MSAPSEEPPEIGAPPPARARGGQRHERRSSADLDPFGVPTTDEPRVASSASASVDATLGAVEHAWRWFNDDATDDDAVAVEPPRRRSRSVSISSATSSYFDGDRGDAATPPPPRGDHDPPTSVVMTTTTTTTTTVAAPVAPSDLHHVASRRARDPDAAAGLEGGGGGGFPFPGGSPGRRARRVVPGIARRTRAPRSTSDEEEEEADAVDAVDADAEAVSAAPGIEPPSTAPPAPPSTAPPSTAPPVADDAKKAAIRLKTRGWWEAERALVRVVNLLIKEMKPLGMEGVATFDPIAGIMLWREQRKAAAARRRARAELYPNEDPPPTPDLKPLILGMKHSVAVYGALAVIMQKGFVGGLKHEVMSGFKSAGDDVTAAAARSAGIDPADIVSANWSTLTFSPASYVAIDRGAKTVVVAIRGTAQLEDLLTDACCTSVPFCGGWAHAGVVASAWQVVQTQIAPAARAMANNPTFELLLTGHSMGAGVAACIAMLLRLGDADVLAAASEGIRKAVDEDGASEEDAAAATRNVTRAICHCFAAPSTCSLDLSNAAREYVTAVVAGKDVIPRLCYGSVRRLLRRLNSAAPSQPMMRAISNALGGRDKGGSQGIGRRGGGGDGDGDESPLYVAEEDARAYEEDEAEITGRMSALHDFHAPTASDKPKIPEPEPRDADESESDLAPDETDRSASNAPPPKPPDGDGAAAAATLAKAQPRAPSEREREEKRKQRARQVAAVKAATSATAASGLDRCQAHWDDLEGVTGLELRDHGAGDFLVQPGRVIHLRHLSSDDGPTAEERHPTAFTEIPLSTRMMTDHIPMVYMSAMNAVVAAAEREKVASERWEDLFAEEVRVYGPGGYDVYADAVAMLSEADAKRLGRRGEFDVGGGDGSDGERTGGGGGLGAMWAQVRRAVGMSAGSTSSSSSSLKSSPPKPPAAAAAAEDKTSIDAPTEETPPAAPRARSKKEEHAKAKAMSATPPATPATPAETAPGRGAWNLGRMFGGLFRGGKGESPSPSPSPEAAEGGEVDA